MLRTYYCFSLLSCLFPLSVFGQITGTVLDSQTKVPIEYATIILTNGTKVLDGTISKRDGSFEISVSPKLDYKIEISFLGYETQNSDLLKMEKGKEVALGEIFLRPTQTLLNEVVLSKNQSSIQSKIDRQVYGASEFSIAKGGNAADLIRNLPSISINAIGEISVRGSRGFVILLNDKPIQSDIKSLLNQIPANSIKNIEVITAPSAKYDAEGKAGIINILTLKNAVKGDYFQVNTLLGAPSVQDYENAEIAQRYGADITYNTVGEKWNLSTGFSFQRNDLSGRREGDVYTIISDKYTRFPSDGERSFDEINYSGRLTADYQLTERDQFSLGFFAGKRTKDRTADILYYANYSIISDIKYEFQYYNENLRIRKSDFILGSLDYEHKFKNEAELSSSILYEYSLLGGPTTNRNLGYPDNSIIYQDEYNTNNNPLYGLRINLDYQFRPFSNGTFEMGYQYRNLDHTGDFVYERKNNITQIFELVPEFSSEVNLKRSIHSGYLQYNGSFEKWSIASGLRVENMQRDLSLKDKSGKELPYGGFALSSLEHIDISNMDERMKESTIMVACDVNNPLYGSRGASAIYGPQKGASYEQVQLLDEALNNISEKINEDNINLSFIGDLTNLPKKTISKINKLKKINNNDQSNKLIIAWNYSGRSDIVNALNNIKNKDKITEKKLESHLMTNKIPDPDLIIRTGNQIRLSNFMLWQAAYSELYFSQKLWPDFNKNDLNKALKEFEKRRRNYGSI